MKKRTHEEVMGLFGAIDKIGQAMNNPSPKQSLNSLKSQLKVAKDAAKKSARRGKRGWGDYYQAEHIKDLEREIQSHSHNNQDQ